MTHSQRRHRATDQRVLALAAVVLCVAVVVPSWSEAAAETGSRLALSADRNEMLVGERLCATLQVLVQPGVELALPGVGESIGAFEIIEVNRNPNVENRDGLEQHTVEYEVTTFELGEQALGPIEATYVQDSSDDTPPETRSVESGTVTVRVQSVLPPVEDGEEPQVRPVRPPFEMPFEGKTLWIVLGVVLAIVAVAVLGAWLLRRLLRRREVEETPVLLPDPDEEALQALAEMETTGALERDMAKEVYSRLSYILRRYLGRRHRFDALEMTSSELLRTIEQIGWSEELYRLLKTDGEESDAVKFARYVPPVTRRTAALERVREMVLRTRPAPTPALDENHSPEGKAA